MKHRQAMGRRRFLKGAVGAVNVLTLAGCDNLTKSKWFPGILNQAEKLTELVQRAVTPAGALAKEYSDAEVSADFPANGNIDPGTREYADHVETGFAKWKISVSGLVESPRQWSLPALMALPSRTQVTRHDCVEGWSAIGKWTGVPLGDVMHTVQPLPAARFAILHCADIDEEGISYYESMAIQDCYHPQTILAYELNGQPLDIAHGAPVRLRFERQLGYKHAKYITGIELVESLRGIGGGKGGYWEDQGYEWYAGI